MAPKKPNKLTQKKPILRIPKDTQVKIIEITPRTFLFPLLGIALFWALYSLWATNSSELITYDDTK
jgi:hypothetical protein